MAGECGAQRNSDRLHAACYDICTRSAAINPDTADEQVIALSLRMCTTPYTEAFAPITRSPATTDGETPLVEGGQQTSESSRQELPARISSQEQYAEHTADELAQRGLV